VPQRWGNQWFLETCYYNVVECPLLHGGVARHLLLLSALDNAQKIYSVGKGESKKPQAESV
jgi:hypothetical protein